jgi:hypothetical protein
VTRSGLELPYGPNCKAEGPRGLQKKSSSKTKAIFLMILDCYLVRVPTGARVVD